jgi:LAGLIDADG endonuclease
MIAFLGYVLPYGQMSYWGIFKPYIYNLTLLPIIIKRKLHLSNNKDISEFNFKDLSKSKLIEIFVGILDGDGYFDIGPQKQYNKNPNNKPKSTIRMRLGINLQCSDKELLELLQNKLGVGKINYNKSQNQYRLILFKTDILNVIYPYLQSNNIEFLNYNRRKQYFLFKYVLENNITHWDDLNLEDINNLFLKSNKQINFFDILKLPYFYNWLVGFTVAEGSFHIKSNGRAHYSIVQSGHENYNLIKAIHYFVKGSSSLDHKINPEDSKIYRISFSSKIDLTFIMNFFDNNQLLGLKKLQFDNWKSYIISNNKIISSAPNVILTKVSNEKVLNNNNTNNNNNEPRNE